MPIPTESSGLPPRLAGLVSEIVRFIDDTDRFKNEENTARQTPVQAVRLVPDLKAAAFGESAGEKEESI